MGEPVGAASDLKRLWLVDLAALAGVASVVPFAIWVDVFPGYAAFAICVYAWMLGWAHVATRCNRGSRIGLFILGGLPLALYAFSLGLGGADPTPFIPLLLYGIATWHLSDSKYNSS